MITKIAVAFFAILLLSGCSASRGKYGDNNKHIVEFEREIGDRVFFALNSSTILKEGEEIQFVRFGYCRKDSQNQAIFTHK